MCVCMCVHMCTQTGETVRSSSSHSPASPCTFIQCMKGLAYTRVYVCVCVCVSVFRAAYHGFSSKDILGLPIHRHLCVCVYVRACVQLTSSPLLCGLENTGHHSVT